MNTQEEETKTLWPFQNVSVGGAQRWPWVAWERDAGGLHVMLHLHHKHANYLSEWLIMVCKMESMGWTVLKRSDNLTSGDWSIFQKDVKNFLTNSTRLLQLSWVRVLALMLKVPTADITELLTNIPALSSSSTQ